MSPRPRAGDKVEFEWGGSKVIGTVTAIDPEMEWPVAIDVNGREFARAFSEVRVLAQSKPVLLTAEQRIKQLEHDLAEARKKLHPQELARASTAPQCCASWQSSNDRYRRERDDATAVVHENACKVAALTGPGDELQSAASRLAEYVESIEPWNAVPYEVRMAQLEAGAAVQEWTEARRGS